MGSACKELGNKLTEEKLMNMYVCEICLFVILLRSVHPIPSSCISDLEVESISSTTATISWVSQCDSSSFIVSWSHQEFVACQNKDKLVDIFNKTVENQTRARIEQLRPFSVYNFTVAVHADPLSILSSLDDPVSSVLSADDLLSSMSVTGLTEESIPQVRPSPVPDYSLDTSDSLLFQWTVPKLLQCAGYQARLGYLFFKLIGRPRAANSPVLAVR